ncbi:MAG: T9SS C-terminal target domain-containing protein, partial [Cryomorphaceae bacterium]
NTGETACVADCNGDFGGTAFFDNCGDCVGGNTGETACLADCNGDFGGTAFLDNCGDCVGGNTGETACVADCNGDFGGTAFIDNCGDCVGGNTGETACLADCNGDFGGTAFIDNCGDCVGGNTGETACVADCNGDFGGTAFIDDCGDCVGGNTQEDPCELCDLVLVGSSTPASGPGNADGTATVVATGGSGTYSYSWNDPLMQNIATATGLFPGNYTVLVSDGEGCNEQITVNVGVQGNVPFTQVHANFCNTGGYALGDFISAQQVAGATAYRWEFTDSNSNVLPEYTRVGGNPWVRLEWISGIELGETYDVRVKTEVGGEWGEYGISCSIGISPDVPNTSVRPEYSPTNPQGNPYSMCDIVIAFNIAGAEDFEWRFDPDSDPTNGNEIYYVRGAANPGIRLSWIEGLVPGTTYHVGVRVKVSGQWGDFGDVSPIILALPPNNVTVRPQYCGVTHAPNGILVAQSVCAADFYQWEFVNLTTGVTSTAQRPNPGISLNWNQISPLLTAGDCEVRVRVQQGGILGDFGPVCTFTISGPGAPADETPAVRTLAENSSMLYPNPNAGTEVRLELSGLGDENHEVMIQIYDINGQLIQNEGFGHVGDSVSRLIHFNKNLATGMYMVHIVVDGERFATERLIVM